MSLKDVLEDLYPLSPMQQGMFFHSLYAPASGVYVVQMSARLTGLIDREAFRRAWQHAIDRHPILRSAVMWEDLDEPLAIVYREAVLPFDEPDLRGLPDREERLEAYLAADRERGFELGEPPLLRVALVRLGEDEHELVFSHHHLLLDAWSGPLLLQEVFAAYAAFRAGGEPRLERTRPFRDYIAWLQGRDLAQAEAFWRRELAGFTAPTPLPADPEAAPEDGGDYAFAELMLADDALLRALAGRHQVTLNTLFQAAWALALRRYSGEDDVVFGAVISGRPADLPGAESMLGMFINTLPVRARMSADEPLLPWLRALQERQVEVRQHEHSPLVRVQGWSEVPRGTALFESILIFANYPTGAGLGLEENGLSIGRARNVERTNFPLTLEARADAGFLLKAMYQADRFGAEAVQRLLGHLATLLGEMAAAPAERHLGDLQLLAGPERRQLLYGWNDTARDYGVPVATLHGLVERQAAATPDAVALAFRGERLTYQELDELADRLARHLLRGGLAPEARVGVVMERSVEMVVALLATLKAGAAYVPLDPSYPPQRLAGMLEDARVEVLLTQSRLTAGLPDPARVIRVDEPGADWRQEPAGSPAVPVDPDRLAYVIFTSGSTGRPKGAMNSHRAIVNRLLWMQETYDLTSEDWVLQKTPFSFDVSVWEFFWPLLTGARLVVAEPGGHLDGAYLVRLIREEGITTVHFVPSMLGVFLEEPGVEECVSLRRVICSGEALPFEMQERFFARLGAGLHNLYGPTEAAVDVTFWKCRRDAVAPVVPIGRPVANTAIHLMDRDGDPAPVGVPGELLIGGVQLARGYLGRPDLTAERFVPDPFAGEPGARLYRTGDLARRGSGGEVEYLGRLDHQVKVRGFRIELGEIESVLAAHPQVRQSVVTVARQGQGGDRLVVYVVPDGEPPATPALLAWLRQRLPDFMVPSLFMTLAALPLSPNGKLDRRALPSPEGLRPELETAYVAPESELERQIAAVWREVLQVEKVGTRDNFFDLGGHSLLMVQALGKLRKVLGRGDLTIVEVFQYPTISLLARYLTAGAGEDLARQGEQVAAGAAGSEARRREQLDRRRRAFQGAGIDG